MQETMTEGGAECLIVSKLLESTWYMKCGEFAVGAMPDQPPGFTASIIFDLTQWRVTSALS